MALGRGAGRGGKKGREKRSEPESIAISLMNVIYNVHDCLGEFLWEVYNNRVDFFSDFYV